MTSEPADVYKILKIMLEITGSWPKLHSTIFYKFRKVINFIFSVAFILFGFIKSVQDFKGVESISYGVFITLECAAYMPKLVLFYYKRDKLLEIIKRVDNPLLRLYDEDLDIYMKNKIKFLVKLSVGFYGIISVTTFGVGLLPFFGHNFHREPPLPLPIDLKGSPFVIYIFFWTFQVGTLTMCAYTNASMDILACGFMGITSAHLEILREQLLRMANFTGKSNFSEEEYLEMYGKNDDEVIIKIKKYVEYHGAIERLVQSVDDMFNLTFLLQFFGSVAVICLNCFCLILFSVTTAPFIVSFLFLVCVFVELAIYCAFGQDVIVQSSKIADACFMSEWWNCGKEVRKSLFIIMERTKRPYQFTAGKFIIISLTSFLAICKSAFSYMTVLNQMYAKSSAEAAKNNF